MFFFNITTIRNSRSALVWNQVISLNIHVICLFLGLVWGCRCSTILLRDLFSHHLFRSHCFSLFLCPVCLLIAERSSRLSDFLVCGVHPTLMCHAPLWLDSMHVSVGVVADRWVVIIHTISFHPFVSVVTGPAFSYETKYLATKRSGTLLVKVERRLPSLWL